MLKEGLALFTALITSPVAVWRVVVVVAFGGHVVWACSWLPGLPGFSLKAEAQESEKRLSTRLDAIENKQNITLRLALSAEICRLYRLRNATADAVLRDTLDASFQQKQDDYAIVNGGSRYPVGECP